MAIFDGHVMVDWSANGRAKTGKDSIWIAVSRHGAETTHNPPTRLLAEEILADLLTAAEAKAERLLVGLDFPFGYPAGLTAAIPGAEDWRDVWRWLAARITEGPKNRNNRFEVAAELNRLFPGAEGPFWGCPTASAGDDLRPTKPKPWRADLPAAKRAADKFAPGAKEVWQLFGSGSVGGQALTGIAMLERLRQRHAFKVWPFEAHDAGHVVAEIYPSLIPVSPSPGQVKDTAQVIAMARAFAQADATGLLKAMLDIDLSPDVHRHEATMLGLSHLAAFKEIALAPL